ncbi:GNAT family N-acetyltransferase [Arcanobacterium hippocoleae]|uniref:GNAT superfamily N-acetyltransferase n=1 Tax=Arcanobacterium hippocoleae TaxID=149017 RepID=A0ABU1T0M6_9ACTO|nr:GNAT family N-acetyltransferase [Arcanobacterium hippocoleae]MDR6938861.1 GNAT superfamily N-acetyltransferase [Arcanobacterium hippocoleae]
MNHQQWYWEFLTPACIGEVSTLIAAVEAADQAPIRTARQEVESYFSTVMPWKAQGARSLQTNELIAFGFARADTVLGESVITISGGVHPQWRRQGIGAELLTLQIDLAHHLGVELELEQYTMKMFIDERQQDFAQLVSATNFVHDYTFIQAQLKLPALNADTTIPSFIEIKQLPAEYLDAVFDARNKQRNLTLAQQEKAITFNDYTELGFEPRWCFIAVDLFGDRPELAGYLLCSRFNLSSEMEISEEAYLEELAVFEKWSGRGIETAMFTTALAQFSADGMDLAGVDLIQKADGSEKEINQILRDLGFSPVARTKVVRCEVKN